MGKKSQKSTKSNDKKKNSKSKPSVNQPSASVKILNENKAIVDEQIKILGTQEIAMNENQDIEMENEPNEVEEKLLKSKITAIDGDEYVSYKKTEADINHNQTGFQTKNQITDSVTSSKPYLRQTKGCQQQVQPTARVRGTRGLSNLGNTCFMNSAIQCMTHVPQLTDHLISQYSKNNKITKNKLLDSYVNMLSSLWDSGSYGPFAPYDFKRCISNIAQQFSGYSQMDFQEFLSSLLTGLNNELKAIQRQNKGKANKEISETIVDKLFYGEYKNTFKCQTCKAEQSTYEPFSFVKLPEGSTATTTKRGGYKLESLLKELNDNMEVLDEWYCEVCEDDTPTELSLTFNKLPEILLIRMKAINYESRVEYPLRFNTNQFIKDSNEELSCKEYKLISTGNHYGGPGGGHYTANCLNNEDNKWYCYNDSSVSPIFEERVCTSSAICLIYMAVDDSTTTTRV